MRKCPVYKRTARSAASTKTTTKMVVKAEMATALVKEERPGSHEPTHSKTEDSDDEERKLATKLRSLERYIYIYVYIERYFVHCSYWSHM